MFITFCSGAAVAPTASELRELRSHVDLIIQAAGLGSVEKLAVALDVNEAQLHRQLQGDGHLSLTRIVIKLGLKDPDFFPEYAWLVACRYGLPRRARVAADMDRALNGRRSVVNIVNSQRSA